MHVVDKTPSLPPQRSGAGGGDVGGLSIHSDHTTTFNSRRALQMNRHKIKAMLASLKQPSTLFTISLSINVVLVLILVHVYRPAPVHNPHVLLDKVDALLTSAQMRGLPHVQQKHLVDIHGDGGLMGGDQDGHPLDTFCNNRHKTEGSSLSATAAAGTSFLSTTGTINMVRQPCQACGEGYRGSSLEILRGLHPKGSIDPSINNPLVRKSRSEYQVVMGMEGGVTGRGNSRHGKNIVGAVKGGGGSGLLSNMFPTTASLGADICGSDWSEPIKEVHADVHPILPLHMVKSDIGDTGLAYDTSSNIHHHQLNAMSGKLSRPATTNKTKKAAVMQVGGRTAANAIFGSSLPMDGGELNYFRTRRILRSRRILLGSNHQRHQRMKSMTDEDDIDRDLSDDDATIFISIGQFLDILCPSTIREIYDNARNPRRVFIGLVDQRWAGKEDNSATCYPYYMQNHCGSGSFCPTDNIRLRTTAPEEGKGPTFGRFVAQLLYQGESYYGMIDSHSRFIPHWDTKMILNIKLVPSAQQGKGILSHYPGTFERYEQLISFRRDHHLMTMCPSHYTPAGIIRLDSRFLRTSGRPTEQPFAAAGFVFGDAAFAHHTPFDPHLYYIFDGEEVLYSVRLWTRGWNLYTPREELLFHHYARHGAPRFWSLKKTNYGAQQLRGNNRVKYIMQSLKVNTTTNEPLIDAKTAKEQRLGRELVYYGLGSIRSLEEYRAFGSIEPATWKVRNEACTRIESRSPGFVHKYHHRN